MARPHLIACVHATPRAIAPTRRMLSDRAGEFVPCDLLEEALFRMDAASDEGFDAFLRALGKAQALGPSAILTTCSMYTHHLPEVRARLDLPIVGIDEAMIESAAEVQGPLALVGSRPESIAFARRAIEARAVGRGRAAEFIEPLCVPLDSCDTVSGARQLAQRLRELGQLAQAVVLVQLSLSPAREHLADGERRRVLAGPQLALERLRSVLGEAAT
jgi:hypothetical protein